MTEMTTTYKLVGTGEIFFFTERGVLQGDSDGPDEGRVL